MPPTLRPPHLARLHVVVELRPARAEAEVLVGQPVVALALAEEDHVVLDEVALRKTTKRNVQLSGGMHCATLNQRTFALRNQSAAPGTHTE